MELNIKRPSTQIQHPIIENLTILYSLSILMMIFFDIYTFKVLLNVDELTNNSIYIYEDTYYLNFIIKLFLINIIILFFYIKTSFNLITYNYKQYISKYLICLCLQISKIIFIFYISNNIYYLKLSVCLMYHIASIILNSFSIKMINKYRLILS